MGALQPGWARAMRADSVSSRSGSVSRWSIIRGARSTLWRATAGSSTWPACPPVGGEQPGAVGQPWWNKIAWMCWYQPVCSPTRRGAAGPGCARRRCAPVASTTRVACRRAAARAGGGRRCGRSWRAAWAAQRPVSAGCARNPARSSSSATNRQPVVASKAKSVCWPLNRASQARSSTRMAGLSCPRQVSPVLVSSRS
jgi:hypothetical protein